MLFIIHTEKGFIQRPGAGYTPVIPVTWEAEEGGSQFHHGPGKKHRTLSEK
jgi:hypothetical protein